MQRFLVGLDPSLQREGASLSTSDISPSCPHRREQTHLNLLWYSHKQAAFPERSRNLHEIAFLMFTHSRPNCTENQKARVSGTRLGTRSYGCPRWGRMPRPARHRCSLRKAGPQPQLPPDLLQRLTRLPWPGDDQMLVMPRRNYSSGPRRPSENRKLHCHGARVRGGGTGAPSGNIASCLSRPRTYLGNKTGERGLSM